jgi:capsular exopolysaccharide synthesis family protein
MKINHNFEPPQDDPTKLAQWSSLVPVQPSPADVLFTWEQAARVLRKNRRFALIVAALMTLAIIACAFSIRDSYQPVAQLEIDPLSSGIKTLPEIEQSNQPDNGDYLETQAQILQSDALGVSVIRTLHLDRNPEFVSKKDLAKYGGVQESLAQSLNRSANDGAYLQDQLNLADRTPLESIALGVFHNQLSVSPVRNSRLVEVSYSSHDPALAQLVTNTLVTKFIDQNYRNRYTTTMRASEWLSTQLNDLREKVQEANQAVSDYQKKHGFVEAEDPDAPLTQLMGDVNRAYSDAQANRIEAEAYVRMIDLGQSESIPAVRDDALYQNLMTHYADSRAALAQARAIYGDENSNVKKLEDQSNELAAQVEAERARVINRVRTSYAASRAREEMALDATNKLKERMGDASSHLVEYRVLRNEAASSAELYNTLQSRLKEAGIYAGLGSSNIHIVDLAPELRRATSPNRKLIIAIGAMLSCLLGLVLAFVRESFINTIRTPDDIKECVGLASLAMIPSIRLNRIAGEHRGTTAPKSLKLGAFEQDKGPLPPILANGTYTAEAEAIRDLRTGLMLSRPGAPPRVVLITSPLAGEGKTTVAMNLAMVMARTATTCLIDGDMREAMVGDAIHLRTKAGLSHVLAGTLPVDEALVRVPDFPNLSILPVGALPPNPADLIASEQMQAVMIALRDKFDFVVIDSPPVIHFSDARVLSSLADVVVLVARYGLTTRRSITRCVQILDEVRAPIAGVVLNDIDLGSADYHYYNYGYSKRNSEDHYHRYGQTALATTAVSSQSDKSKGAHA